MSDRTWSGNEGGRTRGVEESDVRDLFLGPGGQVVLCDVVDGLFVRHELRRVGEREDSPIGRRQ